MIIIGVFIGIYFAWPEEAALQSKAWRDRWTRPRNVSYSYQQDEWYTGGTLHKAKMKEWSQASYKNRLATASDFIAGLLQKDGVDLINIDLDNVIKPMAIDFVEGLDEANKDGIADSMDVSEVAATIWVLMKETQQETFILLYQRTK